MSNERKPNNQEISSTTRLLERAGITSDDLRPFRELQKHGFSTFVHGSIISGGMKDTSDIDFAIVGDFSDLPLALSAEFAPGADSLFEMIDYISTSFQSKNGRKMSLHIEKPSFRDNYPDLDKPYALEYRPSSHAKKEGFNKYFLSGMDQNKNIFLFNVTCPQEWYPEGKINTIPQTGVFRLEGESAVCGKDQQKYFDIEHIVTIDNKTGTTIAMPPEATTEIILLGLELYKMSSDTPLFNTDYNRYVRMPQQRSVEALGEFIGEDPKHYIDLCSQNMSRHWSAAKEK